MEEIHRFSDTEFPKLARGAVAASRAISNSECPAKEGDPLKANGSIKKLRGELSKADFYVILRACQENDWRD